MRQKDVQIGQRYEAKVSGVLVVVRVVGETAIRTWKGATRTAFRVVNERTGRSIVMRAARLRGPAPVYTSQDHVNSVFGVVS